MRICIATSSYPTQTENSFAGVFARNFAMELVQRGNEVSVLTQDTGNPSLEDGGIEVFTFPWLGKATPVSSLKPYYPLDVLKISLLLQRGKKQLVQHCLQRKVDLVLALWAIPAGYWGMEVQRYLGAPLAVWCLGSDIWTYGKLPILKLWIRRILKQCTYCFADGFSLAEQVSALSGRSCSFLPTTRILPREGLPELPFNPEKIHYVFIGRYHRNKGPDILLDAIHLIDRKMLSRIQFHFFGMGPLEEDLKRRVLQYGLKEYVTIQGPVDEYTMAALLRKCHALIIPSRIESIPVVLSDALQVDCDLIVTDVGDMGTLVRSYRAGIVVDKESPDKLKGAILDQLKGDQDEFREGRWKLYALFNLEKSVDTFLKSLGIGHEEDHF
jgi:glycosyltransferase involved in cell wall biosynthesis